MGKGSAADVYVVIASACTVAAISDIRLHKGLSLLRGTCEHFNNGEGREAEKHGSIYR